MATHIRKFPEINQKVLFLDSEGRECEVFEYFSDYQLQGPSEQCLTFLDTAQQFAPDGEYNAFKEGIQYSIRTLSGNELIITGASVPPNPKWVPVDG